MKKIKKNPYGLQLGTTVFHRMQNFELSCGICHCPWNFYVLLFSQNFAEFGTGW